MFEGLKHIELSGEKFPIKCDLLVLEKIQDEYGNLTEFENQLTGFVVSKDKDGEPKRNDDGKLLGIYEQPKISVVNKALCWMVKEGLEIEAEQKKDKVREISDKELLRKVDMNPSQLGRKLHEEFIRCFAVKNEQTT